jgi:hypothetical protein
MFLTSLAFPTSMWVAITTIWCFTSMLIERESGVGTRSSNVGPSRHYHEDSHRLSGYAGSGVG